MTLLGELAALGTSLCFSFTSTFFTLAGRRVGSVIVNRIRLLLAVGFLMVLHWVLLGHPLPLGTEPERWFWLGLSGIIGLVIGDALLFQAFVWIGPRLSMLIMSLAPVISTLAAWVFINETLSARQLVAVAITVSGVAWVVLERSGSDGMAKSEQNYRLGILLALGGATGQALGLVTAKQGLIGDVSPISGTLIRMLTATIVMWSITIVTRQATPTFQRLWQGHQTTLQIVAGSFFGPFLGVTLSLVAIQATQVGVAATLMALPPVFLLPIGHFVFHEHIGWRASVGTLLAITGVALLVLSS
jgi:drug/metabolite transporter (DMT)-like permease